MLAVAENFVMRGDHVRFVTGSRYADQVAATGATFVPWPADADFDVEELARRFPDMELAVAPDELEWNGDPQLHGLRSLPVHLGRDRGR